MTSVKPAYLDYAASTPMDPRVAEAVSAALGMVGNPSSTHGFGRAVRAEVDRARVAVAGLFGVQASAVTFTSGATEANALALIGAWRTIRRAHPSRNPRILISPLEHASVTAAVESLVADGAVVDVLPVGADGAVRAEDARAAMTADTAIVSVMWANNVLGTLQPIAAIGRVIAEERTRRGADGLPILLHTDATQAVSSQEVLPLAAGVDLLGMSAHKMYGPKGVGALVAARPGLFEALVVGGGHEGGMRGGTENVPGIVGIGRAAEILREAREADARHGEALRAAFLDALHVASPRAEVVGGMTIPGTVFVRVSGKSGDLLAMTLDAAGFAVSAGSACDSGKRRQSGTVRAVLGESRAQGGGVRVSFGRFTREDELRACAEAIGRA